MIQRTNNEDIVSACMSRWAAEDSRTAYFEEHFDEWISQIPDSVYQLVLRLLNRFEYFSQKSLNDSLYKLGKELDSQPELHQAGTIYTHLPSKKGIENSSIDCLYEYKSMHGIDKFKIVIDFKNYMKKRGGQIDNIVIIDDFCGSGGSMENFIKNHCELLSGKTIYYLVTYTMDEAVQKLDAIAAEHSITLHVLYINHGTRVFEMEGSEEARKSVRAFSRSVGIARDRCLGAYDTEALVAFYDDTPNNTIGLFHCDTESYFSLFPRKKEEDKTTKRPSPSTMKKEKEQRNIQNYNASVLAEEIMHG